MGEEQATRIFIKAPTGDLSSALARTLTTAFGESAVIRIGSPTTEARGNVVVTTDAASSLHAVSEMAENGNHVVLLAALPTRLAETNYRRAGARGYLPMTAADGAQAWAPSQGFLTPLTEAL